MARIIHRSKIYTKEYFLTCLVYGFMFGWGESLFIWMSLPFNVEAWKIIKLNLLSGLIDGLSCLLAAAIIFALLKFLFKSEKLNRDIHQTSWAFATSLALFSMFQTIGTMENLHFLAEALLVIIIAGVVFVAAYQISYRILFRKKNAVRFSLEFMVVIFLLVYLVNHPGFSKHTPNNQIIKPHIFIFDTENIDNNENFLNSIIPENVQGDLLYLDNTYAAAKLNHDNPLELLTVFNADSVFSLLDFLNYYQYHLGFFCVINTPAVFPVEKFHIADDQNYSLLTKVGLIKFYDKLLKFVDLRKVVNTLEGFTGGEVRDPLELTDRITRFITQNRDEFPFFLYIRYPAWDKINSGEDRNLSQSIVNLFNYMKKYSILDNSVIIFTSSSGRTIQRPSYIFFKNISLNNYNQKPLISQRDFPLTLAETVSGKQYHGYFCQNVLQTLSETEGAQRTVFVFEQSILNNKTAISAVSGHYQMELNADKTLSVYDLQTNTYIDQSIISGKSFEQLKQLLLNPQSEVRIAWE